MSKTNVLICDDSAFARKQMARAIPDGWDVLLHFAKDGQEALEMIRAGKGDVMFLDLNMPVMDGYATMEVIRREDLPCLVITVSGDVQPEARTRMLAMGALDFIRKPIDNQKLITLLKQYGIYTGDARSEQRKKQTALAGSSDSEKLDAYRELVNVAMGRAGENLARQLGEFIDLPIPNVNIIENNELHMAFAEVNRNDSVSAVSKGFVSAGINGEALVIFNDTDFENIITLLNYDQLSAAPAQLEALMDISNILIGACLNALSDQLNVTFSHSSPIILGRNRELESLLANTKQRWNRIMAVEIGYGIKQRGIHFELLLLFPDTSMERIYSRLVDIED
ncbi:MAG: response regulator [Pseudomonadota bacterium]|uniref:Response regulator n=1 Tax=Alteromonas alba TaxID=2079529 RepID=A0A2S9V757_9ALTE|nr:response regulator [Alteromonas alba]MAJ68182.1 response regulator [Alteromonadaceae bacterium]MCP4862507.1 response regulator [Alteromonas sp.]MDY6927732.1 response regulator [Pseudomonadota bacterium]RPH20300.1 MAG: response regulator [Alteromonadaceae bacterium TMED7]PRO72289.1 response regulator [Alteromonas alba]|tara:strand:+ start:6357 stop:7370 length:1014 start_codon:yes stop_codon:yes gene_type:complete